MFNGRIFIDGIIVLNFLVEERICTEDAECNLRGDIEILILFEKLIECQEKSDIHIGSRSVQVLKCNS